MELQLPRVIKVSTSVLAVAATTFTILNLYSFKSRFGDFLGQLGIAKEQANKRITSGFLAGYFDHYGIRNLKNVALGERSAVVTDIAAYAKTYVASEAFRAEYARMKESNKPQPPQRLQTPEELRAGMISSAKEGVEKTKESLAKATPETKAIFQKVLTAAQENLKAAEDPNNKNIKAYTQNYPMAKKQVEEMYQRSLREWQAKYPDDYMPMIKSRLQEFLRATENVDFNAQTVEKKGIRYFVNPDYERKSNDWKLAYRAGKETVAAARTFVQQWVSEI